MGALAKEDVHEITEDVRKYAAERGLTDAGKTKEFLENGAEVYAKT